RDRSARRWCGHPSGLPCIRIGARRRRLRGRGRRLGRQLELVGPRRRSFRLALVSLPTARLRAGAPAFAFGAALALPLGAPLAPLVLGRRRPLLTRRTRRSQSAAGGAHALAKLAL